MKDQILDLLGSLVSFEDSNNENSSGETIRTKGLVTSVCFHLDGDHEICIKDFDDSENFHKFSTMKALKVVQIDPQAFFENIKSGAIPIDI